MLNFNDYLKIRDAAKFLGVTESTLRNWQRARKIKVYKTPLNLHRLYKKEELEKVLQEIQEV
ncbi:MAG: MerR family DNA-binding transcriptional regulator [Epsilonproteobacteria bacterium]|nr:MerR family DNA-binding transcriptional regulator [Campylobacterota bacterium]|tara:strand:+ start:1809 stop:1994 length:186 start_codon:yes stop_codon:yes gene_type:complete